jgi:hypothetical protein
VYTVQTVAASRSPYASPNTSSSVLNYSATITSARCAEVVANRLGRERASSMPVKVPRAV